jgi:hypothetical protein
MPVHASQDDIHRLDLDFVAEINHVNFSVTFESLYSGGKSLELLREYIHRGVYPRSYWCCT